MSLRVVGKLVDIAVNNLMHSRGVSIHYSIGAKPSIDCNERAQIISLCTFKNDKYRIKLVETVD